jgi:NAD(P)-dependent dehydrogenase (short-subunit alcohol dehydrogenase family)
VTLSDQRAVVFGGGSGAGLASAKLLAANLAVGFEHVVAQVFAASIDDGGRAARGVHVQPDVLVHWRPLS